MIHVKEVQDQFLAQFERVERTSADGNGAWLLPTRKAAFARFAELGVPTTKDEEWRYTNVSPIARLPFEAAGPDAASVTAEQLAPFLFDSGGGALLVFVNGRFTPDLSCITSQPGGVKVGSLAEAMGSEVALLKAHLARHAVFADHALTALNTAMMEHGALIHVPKRTVLDQPVHLVFVSTASVAPLVSHPRNLIVVEAGAKASVVESYIGLGSGPYWTNTVTEIVAGDDAFVYHYKIVREADDAYHIGNLHLHQHRGSNITSHTVTLGGGLVRNDINALLDGEGGECTLNGLYMADDTRHVDNHLLVDHAKPHCDSREFFKGVLDGSGRGIFSGRIIVRQDAQKTDAKQTNMTLLLSEDAQVESKPQLEIFADDVKCTHGATIGQIDSDAIFYLRSRGLNEEAARSMLIYAFARESIESIRVAALRSQLDDLVFARLPHGELLREVI